MNREWEKTGKEPRIADMLSDPIVNLIMKSDGIGPDQVRAVLACAHNRLVMRMDRAA